ncbi:alpha/beta hydrolase [Thermocatellispora tengchongensis]|uniref:alpha/beta hydrolase n=1 Tax=Thermocatellispora tengchongensis TaxID=1073253 RepID=UPI00362ACF3C
MECAWLRVPLDHRHPEGQKIKIALNRIKGTATRGRDHLGPLLINPGGPGASGLELAKYIARTLPAGVIGRYDVIGFDPRGVGQSVPALSCVDPKRYFKAPRPDAVARNAAEEAVLVGRARAYAQACGSRWAWMLPYMSTEHVARDIDVIRAALGEQKISYFGYSYGTYLGAVYASLFPGHVRRLVLDSVVDPAGDWYSSNIAQDYAFERRHRDFLAWVARHNAVYRLGDDPEAVRVAYYAMRDRLRAHPAGKVIGPSELDDIFTVGGYNNTVWPELAAAFSAYVRQGDGGKLVEAQRKHAQNGPKEENGYAVYLSVQCRDSTWSRDWNSWRADMIRVNRAAPFMTWPNAWYNAPCAFWSVPGGTPPRITASPKLPPVLMLQSRRDAATPYEGALRMRRLFPNARMVVEPGGNHGVSLGGNACVDRHLAAYLRDGTLPASHVRPVAGPDASCPANAAPRPADKAAA